MIDNLYIVVVHGGAGFHPESSDATVKRALKQACNETVLKLDAGADSIHAVEAAIVSMECDECLNAGYGSNLTLDGAVECDASIMDSTGAFGAVGAVSGINHPIKLARTILEYSQKTDVLGRIPPLMLVADGARKFAGSQGHGADLVEPELLVAPRAKQEWLKWKAALDATPATSRLAVDHAHVEIDQDGGIFRKQDTVGAIAWDASGKLSAGVSSGGLLLKHSGRIGEAAVYGAGCWAQQCSYGGLGGVAVSLSGAGEYIIQTMLARRVGEVSQTKAWDDPHEVITQVLTHAILEDQGHGGNEPREVGMILLVKEVHENRIVKPRLWCAFNTPSMAVAYASSLNRKPKAMILRRTPETGSPGGNPSLYITSLPLTSL